jgi:hypothetical protein
MPKGGGGAMRALRAILIVAAILASATVPALADSDKLPTSFENFSHDFGAALRAIGIEKPVTKTDCLPGAPTKRMVCNYKLGDVAMMMAQSEKGGADVTSVTIICTAKTDRGAQECALLYNVAFSLLAPSLSFHDKATIFKTLYEGLSVAQDVRLTTAEARFILQNVAPMGVWFHIEAVDAADD